MTNAQKHALRISEIRERLNEIGGLEGEAYTEAIQTEERGLTDEYKTTEQRYRSGPCGRGRRRGPAQGRVQGHGRRGRRGPAVARPRDADRLHGAGCRRRRNPRRRLPN